MRARSAAVLAIAVLALADRASAEPPVSLRLDGARIEAIGDLLLLHCDVRWINRTGAPIPVRTNFASVHDGLSVEIADLRGRLLIRRAYIQHQSPYAPDRVLALAPGETRGSIVLPIEERLPQRVRARLVGGLPGSGAHEAGLASRWRTIERAP